MQQGDVVTRKAQTRAVFDLLAGEYDVAGPGCFAHYGRRLVDEAGVQPGQQVLDVASGTGAVLLPAAERIGPAGRAVGIDLSPQMARLANEAAARRGLDARVSVMDAEQLAFPDASFDWVLCGFGLMFFPHRDQALAESWRVLRPDGGLGVSTWQVSQADDLGAVLRELGLGGDPGEGWISDGDELAAILRRAGFVDVRVVADTQSFRYRDLDDYWQVARGTGLRRWLEPLDAAQTARVRAALERRVAPHQRTDGLYLDATALLAFGRRG